MNPLPLALSRLLEAEEAGEEQVSSSPLPTVKAKPEGGTTEPNAYACTKAT